MERKVMDANDTVETGNELSRSYFLFSPTLKGEKSNDTIRNKTQPLKYGIFPFGISIFLVIPSQSIQKQFVNSCSFLPTNFAKIIRDPSDSQQTK
jgi:hypothetical protein